jgi:ribose transport system ATP-binding protein
MAKRAAKTRDCKWARDETMKAANSTLAEDVRAGTQIVAPTLELRGISKTFPGVKALDNVSFPVWGGEIHMLCGENGAGKSSLMKVLCGAYVADAGEMFHNGEKIEIKSTLDARKFGIAVIFQEFSLVPYLSVAQNIYLGREFPGKLPGIIDRQKIRSEARRFLAMIGSDIDVDTPVYKLGVAQQQIVEIAKALSQNARILVMDEPTSALSDSETEHLFGMMRRLKANGVAIVYISHRMAEVFLLGDRITILRDGKMVATMLPHKTSPGDLVQKMVGRKVDAIHRRGANIKAGEVALEVAGLNAPSGIADINLTVRAGEIVGLCGLVGSGRTEVARAIFGADRITSGDIMIFGKKFTGGPDKATRSGVALIPESRKAQGLALIRSVGDNIVLAALDKLFPSRVFQPGRARQSAEVMIKKLRIATPSPRRAAQVLSGGNQQKVVIGKWLTADARLFIFDEPTRGIDVGAKAEIFALMYDLVENGAAVLMISSELSEIVNVCDRAYVMREGRIAGELPRDRLTEEDILQLGMHHE